MNGISPVHPLSKHSLNCAWDLLEPFKSQIGSHPLFQRVTANWKVILMDCSTIICITSVVITLLTGSTFLSAAFAVAAVASGTSAYYIRQFSVLSDLESTAQGLKITKERLETVAANLQKENTLLSASNRELQRNNQVFRSNNETLTQTNTRLTHQVTQLTLQIAQLQESTQRIRSEVERFQRENGHLHINVQALDQQILSSRALCELISGQLASQREGLGQQLEQLRRLLVELSSDNRVHEKIQQLMALQTQITTATDQLHQVQLRYAEELVKFQTVHDALFQIRNAFDTTLGEARVNNQELRTNVDALALERQRLHDLIIRHCPPVTS